MFRGYGAAPALQQRAGPPAPGTAAYAAPEFAEKAAGVFRGYGAAPALQQRAGLTPTAAPGTAAHVGSSREAQAAQDILTGKRSLLSVSPYEDQGGIARELASGIPKMPISTYNPTPVARTDMATRLRGLTPADLQRLAGSQEPGSQLRVAK